MRGRSWLLAPSLLENEGFHWQPGRCSWLVLLPTAGVAVVLNDHCNVSIRKSETFSYVSDLVSFRKD